MIDTGQILLDVLEKYSNANKWTDAPFGHIKRISNSHVGDVGQDFVEKMCAGIDFNCEFPINKKGNRSKQSPWDMRIKGITFEVKTATEDVNKSFQFNHVRYHREYQALLCIGIAPDSVQFDAWSKADVVTGKAGKLVSMEKMSNASYKLTKHSGMLRHIDEFEAHLSSLVINQFGY